MILKKIVKSMRNSNMVINAKLIKNNEGMSKFLNSLEDVIISRKNITPVFLEDLLILLVLSQDSCQNLHKETKN